MQTSALERARVTIANALVERLLGRASSAFHQLGEETSRRHVEATLEALIRDLGAGKQETMRAVVGALIEELSGVALSFSDLRFFAQSLRRQLHATLEADPLRQPVDDWLFDFVLVSNLRFNLARESVMQKQAAKNELQRFESQLSELTLALEEKTQLLEMIRQASIPIAPVVQGILVVPLVGTFDSFRAELLTERLLHEIRRQRTRAAILDVSGVPVFDTAAAQLVIRLARAVRLLGTEMLLVGVSPQSARTIVDLGLDLGDLATFGTLQDGLARALALQRLKIGPAAP